MPVSIGAPRRVNSTRNAVAVRTTTSTATAARMARTIAIHSVAAPSAAAAAPRMITTLSQFSNR